MGSHGNPRLEVHLRVGDVEENVGEIDVPIKTTTEAPEGDVVPVTVKVDHQAFFDALAEMLHELADEVRQLNPDDWP